MRRNLALRTARCGVPRTQQLRRSHIVGYPEITSLASRRLQAMRESAAAAVISYRGVAAAFLHIKPAGAGQIYQCHRGERGERKRASAAAVAILLNTRREGRHV